MRYAVRHAERAEELAAAEADSGSLRGSTQDCRGSAAACRRTPAQFLGSIAVLLVIHLGVGGRN